MLIRQIHVPLLQMQTDKFQEVAIDLITQSLVTRRKGGSRTNLGDCCHISLGVLWTSYFGAI